MFAGDDGVGARKTTPLSERGMASALSIDHRTAPESSRCHCDAAPEMSVNFLSMQPRLARGRKVDDNGAPEANDAPPDKPTAARFQEVFVDYVGMKCSSLDAASRHVLDDRFDSFLGKGEREFKDAIMKLMRDEMTPEARDTVAYRTLDSMLRTKMGYRNTYSWSNRGGYIREERGQGEGILATVRRSLSDLMGGQPTNNDDVDEKNGLDNSFKSLEEGTLRPPGHVFVCNASVCDLFCDAFLCPGLISTRKDKITGMIPARWSNSTMQNEKLEKLLPYRFKRYDDMDRVVTHRSWPWDDFRSGTIAPMPFFVGGEVSLEKSSAGASRLPLLPSSERHIVALMETAKQFIDVALRELRANQPEPLAGRERYLLAMPVIGTGGGFAGDLTGEVVEALLELMSQRVLAEDDLDLVLVCADEATYAHAQSIRLDMLSKSEESADVKPSRSCFQWLTDEMRDQADDLAQLASNGQLALFLGAGVSMGSGLPGWFSLLHAIEDLFTPTGAPEERKLGNATKWNPLQMADLLEGICASNEDRFGMQATLKRRICDHIDELGKHPGLLLSLLVSLPCSSIVTQNYDTLIEKAFECWSIRDCTSSKELSVIPYHPRRGASHWLLKMHGCATSCEEIIISGNDYAQYDSSRYKTLCGLLQASLMTKHLLFVGFSLTDPNYMKIVEQVRHALREDSGNVFLRQGSSRVTTVP